MTGRVDRRPEPKPRKHPELWQSYLWWDELMQMDKRHTLRQSSIERGKSNLDAGMESEFLGVLEPLRKNAEKSLAAYGKAVGPIWDWMTSIRGIGAHTAAKLIAQFDDVGKFDTISKFWAFSGWAVRDGHIDRCEKGSKAPYNRRLKSECYLIAENFVRHQTPGYVEIYYEEKEYQRRQHPAPICRKCGAEATQKGLSWRCTECKASGTEIAYTPAHLDARAKRKMIKIFLSHLWVTWREYEGLPVSLPWVFREGGHDVAHYIEPVAVAAE